ncbi:hypothetical protein FGO68_gene5619 [Halteria grandinella]|uniref:Uncharacterized protein n=1 Tax=Halteria grandinella TaxID=5974 RepID=A0A8J8SUC4_HALGN|nr:hypothetical protein FGO68_gene5619 [Halteria grandinella]
MKLKTSPALGPLSADRGVWEGNVTNTPSPHLTNQNCSVVIFPFLGSAEFCELCFSCQQIQHYMQKE